MGEYAQKQAEKRKRNLTEMSENRKWYDRQQTVVAVVLLIVFFVSLTGLIYFGSQLLH